MSATMQGRPEVFANKYLERLSTATKTFPKGIKPTNAQHAIEAHLRLLKKTERRSRCPEIKRHAREAGALLTELLEDIRPQQPARQSWAARWGLSWLGFNS